ncbi:DUF3829 domain-containing protein [Pseudomonas cichorii]|uniref:DUF3829 domain-containing protein n=1 Tax=Pseudomonas cichorii TaxID=36746 RepID=UPI001C88FC0D|nr:DUF3829 domain-containing protein [Pseudomonas cichorii]MBX8515459.1 YiiG family protein [Pseudomonas cichorii]MBX8576264.1 YiiG family protein [Pseudomonas cichorii]
MISTRAFVVAVCVFLGIAWLHQTLVPSRAKPEYESSRLLNMNKCLAYSDTLLRIRYHFYQTRYDDVIARNPSPSRTFSGFGMGTGEKYSASPCSFYVSSLYEGSSPLDIATHDYVQAYDNLRPEARKVEQLYVERYPEIPIARQLNELITQRMDELYERAPAFNQALEQPMLQLRSNQLETIEQRLGRDQHWHTLNFMLVARQAINQLDEQAGSQRLTPEQVQALHSSLLAAWTDAEDYFKTLPRLTAVGGGKPVWREISEPAKTWIDALATLQQHWTARAEPEQLSNDFIAVDNGYDRMWTLYNLAAFGKY